MRSDSHFRHAMPTARGCPRQPVRSRAGLVNPRFHFGVPEKQAVASRHRRRSRCPCAHPCLCAGAGTCIPMHLSVCRQRLWRSSTHFIVPIESAPNADLMSHDASRRALVSSAQKICPRTERAHCMRVPCVMLMDAILGLFPPAKAYCGEAMCYCIAMPRQATAPECTLAHRVAMLRACRERKAKACKTGVSSCVTQAHKHRPWRRK